MHGKQASIKIKKQIRVSLRKNSRRLINILQFSLEGYRLRDGKFFLRCLFNNPEAAVDG
jgi:hypothetical protein